MNFDSLRNDIRNFRYLIEKEDNEVKAGIKKKSNFKAIYNKYKYLFTEKNIELFKNLLNRSTSEEKEKLLNLLFFLINSYVARKVASLEDKIITYINKAKFKYKNKIYKFVDFQNLIINERDKNKRLKIYKSILKIQLKILSYKTKIFDKTIKELNNLGYSYIKFNARFKQIDYFKLVKNLKILLKKTDKAYYTLLNKFFTKYNLKLGELNNLDFNYITQIAIKPEYLPKKNLVPLLKNFLNGIGINLKEQKNIKLDLKDRFGKSYRAWTHVLRAPLDIRVIVRPVGGFIDYRALLHEFGHAEHYANTDFKLAFEFSEFHNGYATTECYAALFEFLLLNPLFLDRYLKLNEEGKRQILEFGNIFRFYLLRRYIGKLIYELKFFTNNLNKINKNYDEIKDCYKDFGECYQDVLTKTSLIIHYKEFYLTDFDYGLYSAEYILAWLAEVQLENYLNKKCSKEWFANHKSYTTLKNLWQYGNKLNIYDIVKLCGYDYVKIRPTIEYFNKLNL